MASNNVSQTQVGPSWDIRIGLLLLAVQFLGQVVFVLITMPIIAAVSGNRPGLQPGSVSDVVLGSAAYLFAGAMALELTRYLAFRRGWPSFRAAVSLHPSNLWPLAVAIALSVALVSDGLALLLGKPIVPPQFRPIFANPGAGAAFGLFMVLVPPLVEEVIFRGVLYPAVARSYGRPVGILISAAIFGLVHSFTYGVDWFPILLTTVSGVMLGALRAYSGSLWPAIAAHATANAYASLEALLLPVVLGYFP